LEVIAVSGAIAGLTLLAVLLIMGGEAALSAFNERVLRARGAVEPADGAHSGHVLTLMTWAYPASFVVMAIEGALAGPAPPTVLAGGLVVLGLSKALKMWAISALGVRWTFRVLVLPDAPLVSHGPYAWLRHPNYVAVIGELLGVALIVWAPVTGAMAVIGYGALLRRKIAVEDRALGRK
jgi:methyltransferase